LKPGKVLLLLLSLSLLLPFARPAYSAEESLVRVELTAPFLLGASEVLYNVSFMPQTDYILEGNESISLAAGQIYNISLQNGKLSLYQNDGMVPPIALLQDQVSIKIVPADAGLADNMIQLTGEKEALKYREAMEFRIGTKNSLPTIKPINIVGTENYLKGVVPREMSDSWELEALKAQAVAARTYATNAMKLKKPTEYINDTDQYQVYAGVKIEGPNSAQAVEETAGQVLTYNGKLISTLYSSSNGGYTETPDNVWKSNAAGAYPYLLAKPDPYDMKISPAVKDWNWQKKESIEEIRQNLIRATKTDVGTIRNVELRAAYPSQRVADLTIEGDKGTVTLTKEQARTALGLRSALYTIKAEAAPAAVLPATVPIKGAAGQAQKPVNELAVTNGSTVKKVPAADIVIEGAAGQTAILPNKPQAGVPISVTFTGKGWGHGVGMSQFGAKQMAKDGKTYTDILDFYYTNVQLAENYGNGQY
jgi:stage II sporulation protein D